MDKGGRGRAKTQMALQVRVRISRQVGTAVGATRPTVFAPALKIPREIRAGQGYRRPLAYYDFHYRRDVAPMLDHLAAVNLIMIKA